LLPRIELIFAVILVTGRGIRYAVIAGGVHVDTRPPLKRWTVLFAVMVSLNNSYFVAAYTGSSGLYIPLIFKDMF